MSTRLFNYATDPVFTGADKYRLTKSNIMGSGGTLCTIASSDSQPVRFKLSQLPSSKMWRINLIEFASGDWLSFLSRLQW